MHPSNFIIGQKVSRLGTKSFDIESVLFSEDKISPICHTIITSVCYDFTTEKSILLYEEIKNDFKI